MKNTVKWIIIAVLLVGLLAGATALYNKYSEEFNMNNQVQNEESTSENANENEENKEETKYKAPDFTVTDYDGNKVKLSDFKGKPVVLNFWATWCYYCKVEMPDFNEAYKNYPDVQFLMVNATGTNGETVDSAKAYVEQEKYEFPVFFDEMYEANHAYGLSSFPMTVFIDAEGNIVSSRLGMLTKEALEEEIAKLL